MIDNLELTIQRDTANAEITVEYDLNWSEFDRLTNLVYDERWELVGNDALSSTTLYVEPSLVDGITADGDSSTHRSFSRTIAFSDLNEDANGDDEIAVVVTLSPRLPSVKTKKSTQVTANA